MFLGWRSWGDWSTCDKTCESGSQMRTRSCLYGEIGQPACIGEATQQQVG